MNPFMERTWGDVHVKLLSRISDIISGELPDDLVVRAEERIEMVEPDGNPKHRKQIVADVAISERWKRGLPPVWQPNAAQEGESMVAVMEPEFSPLAASEETLRWLEVRSTQGFVVTVIEVLSLTNKVSAREAFFERRQRAIDGGANFVEIDLLRGGRPVSLADFDSARPYSVTVYRATARERCESYRVSLRSRLPCFRVPLRSRDNDVPLDLQPLIDGIYEVGRYWTSDFSAQLEPRLESEDAAWLNEMLSAAGLVGEGAE
jgi:hypothetical protein